MYRSRYFRSVDNIIGEVKLLINQYNIDEIQFADDSLIFNTEEFRKLIKELKKLKIFWCTPNGVAINSLTNDLIKEMADSGLYQITLAIDSAAVNTLKTIRHKKVDLNRIPGLLKAAKDCDVFTHGTIVVGMPGETVEDIKSGLDYVFDSFNFTSISTFIASPIPGSELYDNVILNEPSRNRKDMWKTNTTSSCLNQLNNEELERLVSDFQTEFTKKARELDPDIYNRKYHKLIERGLMDTEKTVKLV
jgi:radical SAM superfamily enzyme YgiQ (UPF0313 family)